ncbi:MAG: hypothetical protein JSW71_16235 [Gemmatimonadota bacterium]|nr:MAG: hypothetical protein JSW71_16235 [Gemmatimonadota bacterium]
MITSIGRPLDRNYASNRMVLRLMPLAGVVAGVVALVRGWSLLHIVGGVVAGALSAFGGWALARELAPDHNAAAFASMALAFTTFTVAEPLSFLVLFTTMFLVRIVNRTAGPAARVGDSLVVSGLAIAVVYVTKSPLFGVVAALAFALDAVLRSAIRRQWLFSVACLVVAATWFAHYGFGPAVSPGMGVRMIGFLVVVALAFAVAISLTRTVESRADVGGDRLSVSRVRAGMLIALLVALLAFLLGRPGFALTAAVWASLAGVAGTALLTPLWRPRRTT